MEERNGSCFSDAQQKHWRGSPQQSRANELLTKRLPRSLLGWPAGIHTLLNSLPCVWPRMIADRHDKQGTACHGLASSTTCSSAALSPCRKPNTHAPEPSEETAPLTNSSSVTSCTLCHRYPSTTQKPNHRNEETMEACCSPLLAPVTAHNTINTEDVHGLKNREKRSNS